MEEPPILPRPPEAPAVAAPARKSKPRQIGFGFATGLVVIGLGYLSSPGSGGDKLFNGIAVIFYLPIVGAVLAIIRPTRSFGLGLLLAGGVAWLVLFAICGGMLLFPGKR